MNIVVACPGCSRHLNVPNNLLGQMVKCPSCELTFTASEEYEALARTAAARRAQEQAEAEPEPLPVRDEDDRRRRRDEDDRPRRRRDEDEDDRPRRRRDEDDEDDRPRRRRRRAEAPSKVQAIGVMTLIGGILAVLVSIVLMLTCFGLLWPGTYFSLVCGILCIIKGASLVSDNASLESPPQVTAILQIVNIINLDLINVTMGILILVFLNEPEVRDFYRG